MCTVAIPIVQLMLQLCTIAIILLNRCQIYPRICFPVLNKIILECINSSRANKSFLVIHFIDQISYWKNNFDASFSTASLFNFIVLDICLLKNNSS